MAKVTDTYARAYECCDEVLIETHKFPTIEAIRDRIGVNSPTTIKKAINDWTQAFAEKHFDKMHRPDLPTVLLDSAEQLWKLAVSEAEKAYYEKEKDYREIISQLQAELDEQKEAVTLQAQAISDAKNQIDRINERLKESTAQCDEYKGLSRDLNTQCESLQGQLADQQQKFLEQESIWKDRQDQDQLWFARRLEEEKQFIEDKWKDKQQRQAETIVSLKDSEAALRQACASLRTEVTKIKNEFALFQKKKGRFGGSKVKSRFLKD